MMNTPNIGLSLDTLGYVRLRQAYVHNMRVIEIETGLSLSTNIIGEVLFRRNVRENLAKIAAYLGIPAPPPFNNIDQLRRVLAAAMVRIDAAIGSPINPATVFNTDETSTLDVSQVTGALALFAEMDSIFAAIDAANDRSEIQLAGLDSRLHALEN